MQHQKLPENETIDTIDLSFWSCVLSGEAPTPLAHRCSKFHIKIMGDGDRAYMA